MTVDVETLGFRLVGVGAVAVAAGLLVGALALGWSAFGLAGALVAGGGLLVFTGATVLDVLGCPPRPPGTF